MDATQVGEMVEETHDQINKSIVPESYKALGPTWLSRYGKIKAAFKPLSTIHHNNEVITDVDLIIDHATNHFENLYNDNASLPDNDLIEKTIPKLVNEDTNQLLTLIPPTEEIKSVIISLNKETALSPDGFGGFFYHTF
ncbi:hypothetical protein KIW84_053309 [Lathyrus oleraceus]|uniref:Uncharacterized protein n=1 Tax=Pisum sativum TaxID=3888 RepID=A0A9D4WSF9_PEA|nr:hypothetical protein KIW84_053309 [Pisum sativum]